MEDTSGLVLIQELKCVFPGGGGGGRVQMHLLLCAGKPPSPGRAAHLTTSSEFTGAF